MHSTLFILLTTAAAPAFAAPALASRAVGAGSKAVIAQMFEWTWDSIAAECTAYLGPAGYGYIQASPAQEHAQGAEWSSDYEPISYSIVSKRGNRQQYQDMINTCHNAGVKVIADTIFNHMAGNTQGTGVGGSSFTHYDYPAVPYTTADFHHCGNGHGDQITDYSNATDVQFCELDTLADLATETEYVRSHLAAYANDLLSLGVDGLRLDAAKHIPTADINSILSRLTNPVYITQEVHSASTEPTQPQAYVQNGNVQNFYYTAKIQDAFLSSGISNLQSFDNLGWIDSSDANVFVANHDTERAGDSLNYNSSFNTYTNALIFSLAHPYGTPTVLSSYYFASTSDGAPNGGAGTCDSGSGWICQHRSVGAMVGFRNAVGSAPLTNWVSPASQQIAFARGTAGFVAINNGDAAWTATFDAGLPAGTYCDAANGPTAVVDGACAGAAFTIDANGQFAATVPARASIALYTDAQCTASACSSVVGVEFDATVSTVNGEFVYVIGNITELGAWAPEHSVGLSADSYPVWKATVNIKAGTPFEYKYIKQSNGTVTWESDPNHVAVVSTSGSTQVFQDIWR